MGGRERKESSRKETIVDNWDSDSINDISQCALVVNIITVLVQPTSVVVVVNEGPPVS